VFRRRTATTPDASTATGATSAPGAAPTNGAAPRPGVTVGKGRPTPKRSEAERPRRFGGPPTTGKKATPQSKERVRAERIRKREAMQRGEEWALPVKDKGPLKAMARDYVDSRRRLSEFYMYGLGVLLILLFFRNPFVSDLLPPILLVMILVMVVEGFFLGRKLNTLAAERFPGQSTRGLRMYAAMRGLQIRKMRFPRPRVNIGDPV
jgi:hypothetical protein